MGWGVADTQRPLCHLGSFLHPSTPLAWPLEDSTFQGEWGTGSHPRQGPQPSYAPRRLPPTCLTHCIVKPLEGSSCG